MLCLFVKISMRLIVVILICRPKLVMLESDALNRTIYGTKYSNETLLVCWIIYDTLITNSLYDSYPRINFLLRI